MSGVEADPGKREAARNQHPLATEPEHPESALPSPGLGTFPLRSVSTAECLDHYY